MGNSLELPEFWAGKPTPETPAELLEELTPRQLEVLGMLCEGLSNKLIARRLDISSGTVKVHIVHILRALKVSSRLQAVLIARNAGFEARLTQSAVAQPAAAAAPTNRPTLAEIMGNRREPVVARLKVAPKSEPLLLCALMSKRLDAVA